MFTVDRQYCTLEYMWLGDSVTKGLDALFEGQPDVLNIEDVATLFHRNKATIYRWIKTGVIPAYRMGKEWMIVTAELREALEAAAGPYGTATEETPQDEDPQEAADAPENT